MKYTKEGELIQSYKKIGEKGNDIREEIVKLKNQGKVNEAYQLYFGDFRNNQIESEEIINQLLNIKRDFATKLNIENKEESWNLFITLSSINGTAVIVLALIGFLLAKMMRDIYHAINKVEEMANQACEGSRQVAATTQEQLASSEEIAASSQAIAKMAVELRELIIKFKV